MILETAVEVAETTTAVTVIMIVIGIVVNEDMAGEMVGAIIATIAIVDGMMIGGIEWVDGVHPCFCPSMLSCFSLFPILLLLRNICSYDYLIKATRDSSYLAYQCLAG